MARFDRKFDYRRRFSVASVAAMPTVFATLVGIFLIAVPLTRASEQNERTTSSERSEEMSVANRCDRARLLAIENLRITNNVRAVLFTANVGHSQLPDLDPPAGHRLANGLLAPMTC